MNEPKRWLDGGGGSPESLHLLRVARGPVPLDGAARGRSRRRVATLSTLPVAAAVGWWSTLALGAVIGATGSVAVSNLLTRVSTPPSATSAAASVSARAGLVKPERSAEVVHNPSNEVATTVPSSIRVRTPVPSPSGARGTADAVELAADPLKQELAILERARRSLPSEPGAARLALLEHERRFPGGVLSVERELLMVDALVRLGRRREADARATALEVSSPKNLYGERLDQILGRR